MIALLLDKRANCNAMSALTPLMAAARERNLHLCSQLLSARADASLSSREHGDAQTLASNDYDTLALLMADQTTTVVQIKRRLEQCMELAESGKLFFQFLLGKWLSLGVIDDIRAGFCLRRAAEAGSAVAQIHLGLCFRDGKGVTKDDKQAEVWFLKAAVAKDETQSIMQFASVEVVPHAQYLLGELLSGDTTNRIRQLAGYGWLTRAAERGYTKAMFKLGLGLVSGLVIDKDPVRAVFWFRKAADNGLPEAQCQLVHCLLFGVGGVKDEVQAVTWLLRVCEAGENTDHFRKCFRLARRAAKLGLPLCWAKCLELGLGTSKAPDAALRMYCDMAEKLAEKMEYAKEFVYARDSAFRLCTSLAEQGDANAQFQLAGMLSGSWGVVRDDKQVIAWYQRAAEQGHSDAQHTLAMHFLNVVKDEAKARLWLRKAADNGSHVSALLLVKMGEADPRASTFSSGTPQLDMISVSDLKPPFELLAPSSFGQAVKCTWIDPEDGVVRHVVVKVPKEDSLSPAWMNEWLALSAIPAHPNVITLWGLCENFACTDSAGKRLKPPFSFVSPFFKHGSISDFFAKKENKGHSARFLLPWALDIARGLAHLHRHKLVHRDLAARNVFITAQMKAVVGDLGLARQCDDLTGVFVSEGKSAAYPIDVVPQVLKDKEYTPASDIYTLGLTMFEIATECQFASFFTSSGASSFCSKRGFARLQNVATMGYSALMAKLPASLPDTVRQLILRCLAFEPDARPTAQAIVDELQSGGPASGTSNPTA